MERRQDIILFQRRIGAASDQTWEDMTAPDDCHNVADLMSKVRESETTGVYRVFYKENEFIPSTQETLVLVEQRFFEVREVTTYEVRKAT